MCSRAVIVVFLLGIVVPSTGLPQSYPPPIPPYTTNPPAEDVRLPSGKRQIDEILKSDRDKSVDDVKQLIEMAQALQKDLEARESQQVLSLSDIHRTEEIEKIAKRIRSRMRRS